MAAYRIGRVERAVQPAFIASEGKPLRTRDLLAWAYPRIGHYRTWHHTSVYRAAPKFSVRLGKDGHLIIWGQTAS